MGLAIAVTIKFLIARYQEVLNLRKSQIELRKLKSEAAADLVETDISARIEKLSEEITEKVLQRFKKKATEERPLVQKAVLKLARMIDRRYRIEIRVSDDAEVTDEAVEQSSPEISAQIASARQEILEIQTETKFFEAEKDPLLLLTDAGRSEPNDENNS